MKARKKPYESMDNKELLALLRHHNLGHRDLNNRLAVVHAVVGGTPGDLEARNEAIKRLKEDDASRLAVRDRRLARWGFICGVLGVIIALIALAV